MSETATETQETTEAPKRQLDTIDPASLGQGLYTEVVTVDPSADPNAPMRPIDEQAFDENGKGTPIMYEALLTAPQEGSTNFYGEARQFIQRGKNRDGQEYWLLNLDAKIVAVAGQGPESVKGRGGRSFSDKDGIQVYSTVRDVDGKPTSGLFDLASKMGLLGSLPAGNVQVDNEKIVQAVVQTVLGGQARIGVFVKWFAGYNKPEGAKKGSFAFGGQANFPKQADGRRNPVVNAHGKESRAIVKLNGFARLPQ